MRTSAETSDPGGGNGAHQRVHRWLLPQEICADAGIGTTKEGCGDIREFPAATSPSDCLCFPTPLPRHPRVTPSLLLRVSHPPSNKVQPLFIAYDFLTAKIVIGSGAMRTMACFFVSRMLSVCKVAVLSHGRWNLSN